MGGGRKGGSIYLIVLRLQRPVVASKNLSVLVVSIELDSF